jgi:hypothetical protein
VPRILGALDNAKEIWEKSAYGTFEFLLLNFELLRPCSPTDRVSASGAEDGGSIPPRDALLYTQTRESGTFRTGFFISGRAVRTFRKAHLDADFD